MSEKQKRKLGPTTIKGAILEIVLSLLFFVGSAVLLVFAYATLRAKQFNDWFLPLLFVLGVSFICFVDGIISIFRILKQRKEQEQLKNESKKDDTKNF